MQCQGAICVVQRYIKMALCDVSVWFERTSVLTNIPYILESNPHQFLPISPSEVTRWVSAAWKAIPESIIVRSFKKCCISNALDGSEDDILWEDDGEDKDDSDWVTDNDSVMNDDGESDE